MSIVGSVWDSMSPCSRRVVSGMGLGASLGVSIGETSSLEKLCLSGSRAFSSRRELYAITSLNDSQMSTSCLKPDTQLNPLGLILKGAGSFSVKCFHPLCIIPQSPSHPLQARCGARSRRFGIKFQGRSRSGISGRRLYRQGRCSGSSWGRARSCNAGGWAKGL